MTYYYKMHQGEAVVLVDCGNSHSIHRADDRDNGGPDAYASPYPWGPDHGWIETNKEHAETLVDYEFGE